LPCSSVSDIKHPHQQGLEQGYLTYAEVNDHLPDDMVDPEQIEDIIGMINDMGIEVHEVAPGCRDPAAGRTRPPRPR
jgi:RNA polymerase primary sigma factor